MLTRLKTAVRALLLRSRAERELDEELHNHIERQTEQNIRLGMDAEEARYAARKAFGGVEQAKEQSRDMRGVGLIEDLWQDIRYGVRMFAKNPGFTLIAIATLSLGIAANTVMFSAINGVLLQPLPFHHPEQLFTLWERNPSRGQEHFNPAAGNFVDWRNQNQVFAQMAIYDVYGKFTLAQEGQPERIVGAAVSASLFEVLGVGPSQGRIFTPEEEQPGRGRVVLISHGLWERRLAADPHPIGKTMILNGASYTVIGVMPEGFQFPGGTGTLNIFTPLPAELWVPLVLDAGALQERAHHYLNVIARLKPDISIENAETAMSLIQQRLVQQYPNAGIGTHIKIVPLSEQAIGTSRRPLLLLWGAVVFVLLIVCANIANLLLSRATARRREIAIRAALGAGRRRVIRQLLTESLLLSLTGGMVGILLAVWGVEALLKIIPDNFPRREEIIIDRWVLAFTTLTSILSGVIFGLVPALRSSRTALTEALKEGGHGSTVGFRHRGMRGLLVIAETSLALTLLIAATLMMQSFLRLKNVDPGFNTDRILTMELSLPHQYPQTRRAEFFRQLIERGKIIPGVEAVSAAKHLPLSGDNMSYSFNVVSRPFPPGQSPGAAVRTVTADYFNVLGIPIVKGRVFNEQDGPDSPPVLVINEATSRRYFPNEDPIGQRVRLGLNYFTGEIIGVVKDVKHIRLDDDVQREVYFTYNQAPIWTDMTLLVRTTADPMKLAGAFRNEVRTLDKVTPVTKVRTMDAIVAGSISDPRFRSLSLGLFAAAAMVLTCIGIYGVMSYEVEQHRREIGIRMALGAQTSDVLRLVVKQGMTLALVGVAIGMAASFGLTRLMKNLLFEISTTDPFTFIVVSLLLILVALLACYLPARRATRVDPIVVLHNE